jgi:hypothetical protein
VNAIAIKASIEFQKNSRIPLSIPYRDPISNTGSALERRLVDNCYKLSGLICPIPTSSTPTANPITNQSIWIVSDCFVFMAHLLAF